MKKFYLLLLTASFFILTQCNEETPEGPAQNLQFDCTENANLCNINSANIEFGFDVFKKIHEKAQEENIFISPLSIATALSMTVNGAEGQTKADMQSTMHINSLELQQINEAYKTLLQNLPILDSEIDLEIANSIWHEQSFSVEQPFLDVNSEFFFSQVQGLDFKNPASKDIINEWVSNKTKGLINSIVDEIPPQMVMYLINATYFKGAWKDPFDPDRTFDSPFFINDGLPEMVEMMNHGQFELPYFETEQFQAVDLAYGDSIFSMSLLLPKETSSINELIGSLTLSNWEEWINNFQDKEIFFSMPKFKMEYKKQLNDVLKDLGMQVAFSKGLADFSKINPGTALYIDQVMHKSFIEVNEEGTEAAAVTSVGVGTTSVPVIPYFSANRPFLFVIRENKTNSILFIGKMMNPKEM